jgi:4a-hydroxytetrahydrobiopterin dehydratase
VSDEHPALSRAEASAAVESIGWRYLLGTLCASVPVSSLGQAAAVAAMAAAACGADADGHLRLDLRPDRVELSLQDRAADEVTRRDAELAEAITEAVAGLGAAVASPVTASPVTASPVTASPVTASPVTASPVTASPVTAAADARRPVQMLELAIDALDIPAVLPFWRAVLGYSDEPAPDGPPTAIVDPAGQLPAVWFQQMDAPRPQRNRIHFDVTVAHDEAESRVQAALAAGGVLVSDSAAPSFWVLADAEGNEACVCTWLGRDERGW